MFNSIVLQDFTEGCPLPAANDGNTLRVGVRKQGGVDEGLVIRSIPMGGGLNDPVKVDQTFREEEMGMEGLIGGWSFLF